MDIDRFLKGYLNVLLEDKKDSKYETLRILFNGLSGIRTAKLLNFASLCMDANSELYCEIGTYRGYTLLSAGYENRSTVLGIDYAKPEWCSPAMLDLEHLPERMGKYEQVNYKFINDDFRNVQLTKNVAVLFIDGDHYGKEVKDALEWSRPFLVNDAIVVFDDVAVNDVGDSILKWVDDNKNDELIYYSKTFETERAGTVTNHYLANGIAIMRHHA